MHHPPAALMQVRFLGHEHIFYDANCCIQSISDNISHRCAKSFQRDWLSDYTWTGRANRASGGWASKRDDLCTEVWVQHKHDHIDQQWKLKIVFYFFLLFSFGFL